MKIGIVVTVCNGLQYNREMVDSIRCNSPWALIIVDDYSIDGTKEWIKTLNAASMPNCTGVVNIEDPDTDSLAAKWNLGVEMAVGLDCDVALVCNNDILFSPATIDAILARFEKARANNEPIAIVTAHNRSGDITEPHNILTTVPPIETSESEGPDFSCFCVDPAIWDKVGRFNTDFKPCYFEDNDFHMILRLYGYKAISITAAPYYHYGSRTQNSVPGGLCKPPQFEHNRQVFIDRFGYDTDEAPKRVAEIREKMGITPLV